jgi:two-component system nitrogen regulation response regulator GlnG
LPPLRSRPEDIEPLAEHFLNRLTAAGRNPPQLSPAALEELQQRNWRGNVRELRNVLEHALIVSRGQTIQPEHLSRVQTSSSAGTKQSSNRDEQIRNLLREWTRDSMDNPAWEGMLYEKLLELVEQPVFEELLAALDNQVLPAARILGLHRTTLRRKIDRLTD